MGKISNLWIYVISTLLILLAWKALAVLVASPVLPYPEDALAAFADSVKTADFWGHFGISAFRVIAAMALALVIAFPLGVLLGYSPRYDKLISPFVFLTYPIPKIVFLPIILVLLGLGDISKIVLIVLIIAYQILVATRDGVVAINRKFIDSIKSLGGGELQIVRHVIVPAALPHCFTALRISTGTSIAVLFFVESFATSRGLGYQIMDSWGRASYEQMFVGIIGMSLLGALLYGFFGYMERSMCAWKLLESGQPAAGKSQSGQRNRNVAERVKVFGVMIKFSHTVFALPFALAAVILAQREAAITPLLVGLIIIAFIGARSAAMGFNRLVDAQIDARNPRTADRAIPTGLLTPNTTLLFVLVSCAVFIIAAGFISRLCLYLAVPVLFILFFYSYTKRFSSFSHLFLGFSIGLAPLGAWIAVTGTFSWEIILLSIALMTYIAGFDILYACQDIESDREQGLFSIPARMGIRPAMHISTLLHVLSFLLLLSLHLVFDMGLVYFIFVVIIGILLIIEHRLIAPDDISRIDVAFFHVNSVVSIVLFLGILLDEVVRRVL